jgi:hypothetical protein
MIYIVTGLMRSGTSMMMHALIAGGMKAAYERKDTEYLWDGDYHPNQNGFFELPETAYDDKFPMQFNTKLIKVPFKVLGDLNRTKGMRIVYMTRPFEEINQSYDRYITTFEPHRKGVDDFVERIPYTLGRLIGRKDIVRFDVFDYHKVISRPLAHFELLKSHGWPVNPEKAAAIPDAKLRHYTKEE